MNLLKETINIIIKNKKEIEDIVWIGNKQFKTDWKNFAEISDIEYDHGLGGEEVATDLLVVGNDFWLERHEYDGSEWWEFKEFPKMPKETIKISRVTLGQACKDDIDYLSTTLTELNNIEYQI